MDWRAKVEGLLAKAQSNGATPEESEAFQEKAAYLAAKFGILDAKARYDSKSSEKPTSESFIMFPPHARKKFVLLNSVARNLGGLMVKTGIHRAHVVGFRNDIERIKVIYFSLLAQMHIEMSQARPTKGIDGRSFYNSWLNGFLEGVKERLDRAYSQAIIGSNALVVIRHDAIEEEMNSLFPNTHEVAIKSVISSGQAFAAGQEAGLRTDVGQTGVPGHTRSQIGS